MLAGMPDLHAGPSTGESDATAKAKASDPSPPDAAALPTDSAKAPPADSASEGGDGAGTTKPVDEPDLSAKQSALIAKKEARIREQADQRKIELDRREQALLARENEIASKGQSFEDIKALIRKQPLDALAKLGIDNEDDLEVVARTAYANSKTGKADPRNKAYAEQTAREREMQAKLDAQEKRIEELAGQFKQRDQRAEGEQFVAKYLDEAVKAIPAGTLAAKLHAEDPIEVRQALLQLGQQMEAAATAEDGGVYDRSHTPSHAEVVAEYEKRERAYLKKRGVDVDSILKPKAAAANTNTAKQPAATLDPTSGGAVRPVDRSKLSQEQLRAQMVKDMPWPDA